MFYYYFPLSYITHELFTKVYWRFCGHVSRSLLLQNAREWLMTHPTQRSELLPHSLFEKESLLSSNLSLHLPFDIYKVVLLMCSSLERSSYAHTAALSGGACWRRRRNQ